ncbi:MAG: cytochrome-c peroxidase [Planctomycetota bacterium]
MLRTLGVFVASAVVAVAQSNFPPPTAPANNPPTLEKELLGMALFFEEQVATNNKVACATCHDFGGGGADPRAMHAFNPGVDAVPGTADDQHGSPGTPLLWQSPTPGGAPIVVPTTEIGFAEQVTPRRSPTVINSGYHSVLGYDGRHTSLESFIEDPPINTTEMGHAGRTWADVEQKIAQSTPLILASELPQRLATFIAGKTYPDLFQTVFGTPDVTRLRVTQAIATYIRTLNSDQSRWDKHLAGQAALTPQESLGLQLFTSDANGATSCITCHGDFDTDVTITGPSVGQTTTTQPGPYGSVFPTLLMFHNIGVRPPAEDPGLANQTGLTTDQGKFRVASLRNVALSSPLFHNGGAKSLRDAIEFYNRGGDFHQNQAALMFARNYSATEVDALVALLETLTDDRLVTGTYPFDRPKLGSQNGKLTTSLGPPSTTAVGKLVATAPYAPIVGDDNFQLTLDGATLGAFTFLMWDTQVGRRDPTTNLQLSGGASFSIFAAGPSQWSLTVTGRGLQNLPLPIPANPQLRGTVLLAQWASFEPSQTGPIAFSNGLRIQLN